MTGRWVQLQKLGVSADGSGAETRAWLQKDAKDVCGVHLDLWHP